MTSWGHALPLLLAACGPAAPEVVGAAPLPALQERPVRHGARVASLALWPVAGWVGFDDPTGWAVSTRTSTGEVEAWDATTPAPVPLGRRPLEPKPSVEPPPAAHDEAVAGCDPAWRATQPGAMTASGGARLERCGDSVVLRTPAGGALDVTFVGEPTGSWWLASVAPWVVVRQQGSRAKVAIWSAQDPEGEVRRTYALPLGANRTVSALGSASAPQRRDPLGYWDVDLTADATWRHVRWADGTLLALGETPVDGVASAASWRIEGIAPLPNPPVQGVTTPGSVAQPR